MDGASLEGFPESVQNRVPAHHSSDHCRPPRRAHLIIARSLTGPKRQSATCGEELEGRTWRTVVVVVAAAVVAVLDTVSALDVIIVAGRLQGTFGSIFIS